MNFYTIYSDYTFPFPQLLPDLLPLHLPKYTPFIFLPH